MDYTKEIQIGFELISELLEGSQDNLSADFIEQINKRWNLLIEYQEFFKYNEKRFYLEVRNFIDFMCDEILIEWNK